MVRNLNRLYEDSVKIAKKSFHGTVRSQRGFLGHVQPHSLIQQLLNSSGEQKTPQTDRTSPPHRDNWSELLETSYGCWTPFKRIKARKEDEWVSFVKTLNWIRFSFENQSLLGHLKMSGKTDRGHQAFILTVEYSPGCVCVLTPDSVFKMFFITRKGLSYTHWEDGGERIDLHKMCVWNSHRHSLHCPSHPLERNFSQGKEGERGRERESLGHPTLQYLHSLKLFVSGK